MLFNFTRSANSAEEAKQFLGLINVNGHFTGIDMGTFLAQSLSAQMTHLAFKKWSEDYIFFLILHLHSQHVNTQSNKDRMCNCFQKYFKWYKIKDKTKSIRRNLTCKGANDQLFSFMNTHLSRTLLTFLTKSSGIFVKIRSCKVVTSSNSSSCFNLQQLLINNSLRWGMVASSTIHFSNFSSIHSFNTRSSGNLLGRHVIHSSLMELPKGLRIFK